MFENVHKSSEIMDPLLLQIGEITLMLVLESFHAERRIIGFGRTDCGNHLI